MEAMEPPGEVWTFLLEGERWIWVRRDPDGIETARSRNAFESLERCQADAMRFGYRSGVPAGDSP
jgi:hypothetical protein